MDALENMKARLARIQAKGEAEKAEREKAKEQEREEAAAQAEAQAAAKAQEEAAKAVANEKSDELSVFVGSVDFKVTQKELTDYFAPCGEIKRCTIRVDKYTKKPKGYAYIEFAEPSGVENALRLDGNLLAGRTIHVKHKRENRPNFRSRRARRWFRRQ